MWSICMLKSQRILQGDFWSVHIPFAIIIIIMVLLVSFSHQRLLMIFYWRLCDSKSSQVSKTLLSRLADLNNTVV